MLFPEVGEEEDPTFISSNQMEEFLKDEAQVFSMFDSLKVKTEAVIADLSVVCEFSDVFPDDISDFPLEREVESSIDLTHDTILVSMAPYMMFVSESGELKNQFEDLLEKKFVIPSVSPWGAPMFSV